MYVASKMNKYKLEKGSSLYKRQKPEQGHKYGARKSQNIKIGDFIEKNVPFSVLYNTWSWLVMLMPNYVSTNVRSAQN